MDKLHDANFLEVAGSVIMEALNREDVSLKVLHGDTTSISVQGDYPGDPDHLWISPTDTARIIART